MAAQKEGIAITEDWTVVILGFALIFLAIAGLYFPLPAFKWSDTEQLFGKVFSAHNLAEIGLQFLITFVIAIAGTWLTGRSIRNLAFVFPVVFVLTVIALVIT